MKFVVGTASKPKLDAVEGGINAVPYFKNENIEIISHPISSDISAQPMSVEETIAGATNRAQNLLKEGIEGDFFVGIEGGLGQMGDEYYLFGCICIVNKNGESHCGFSNMQQIPNIVKKMLLEEDKELGEITDILSQKTGTKHGGGSMYEWSDGFFHRRDEFVCGFVAAICPFFNQYYKL